MVALLVEESTTNERRRLIQEDPVVVTWWGSWIECESALNRLRRDGHIESAGLEIAHRQLDRLRSSWLEVEPLERVRRRAVRLLRLHRLRAADALQLAAALTAASEDPSALELVCSDERLSQAARTEGFFVR